MDNARLPTVTIYTDGACRGNPGPGGWGAVLYCGDKIKEICGGELDTTNNRMELSAALNALKKLTKSCDINLFTDSQYLRLGITQWIVTWQKNDWMNSKKQPIKNVDLWQELFDLVQMHQIKWHWVKGHSGDAGNELADKLANKGLESL